MLGVQRSDDGSWAWIAPCGASGAEHAASRDLTRASYAEHRAACKACSGAAGAPVPPTPKAAAPASKVAAKKAPRRTSAEGAPAAPDGRHTTPAKKKAAVERPANAKQASPPEKAQFTKLVKAGNSLEVAWAAIRKAFPRAEWGKVRDVTLACSPYRTFAAAYKDLHRVRA